MSDREKLEKELQAQYLNKVVKVRMTDQTFKVGKMDSISVWFVRGDSGEMTIKWRIANKFHQYEHSIDYFKRNSEILG